MESVTPTTIPKRVWSFLQAVYYMLRKGMAKRKLILDLHLLLKRGKLAGKALGNLLTTFHNRHHPTDNCFNPREVEFSCSNTPSYPFHFHPTSKRRSSRRYRRGEYDNLDAEEIAKALEIINAGYSDAESAAPSVLPSPSPLFGLGGSPLLARQLRITDSPFPLHENEGAESCSIDRDADEFIKMFRAQLRQQLSSADASATPEYAYRRRKVVGRTA